MKIAIIADIHANIHALDAVLADIIRRQVDEIIVNGDLVNRGPNNLDVLQRLHDEEYTFIMGNHDDLIRLWSTRDPQLPAEWFDDPFWSAIAISAAEVAESGYNDFLASMKMQHRINLDGMPEILITHGSPRHYRDGYAPYSPEEIFTYTIENAPADIYIGSHTHRAWQGRYGGKIFLNTGAVGTPFNRDPRAQYLILEERDSDWHFEFCAVDYDRQAALDEFSRNGYLKNGGLSGYIFREELKYSRPIFDPFYRWAVKENVTKDWKAWEEFIAQHPEMLVLPGV